MKASARMLGTLKAIAKKYDIDLTVPGTFLRLKNDPYMPLALEVVGGFDHAVMIRLSHLGVQEGDTMHDPIVKFYYALEGNPRLIPGLYPTYYGNDYLGMGRSYVDFEDGLPTKYSKYWQADCAGFCTEWSSNIRGQRWIEDGEIVFHDDPRQNKEEGEE